MANLHWAAPRPIEFAGNVSDSFRKFEEHWDLFEKTELSNKTQEVKCSYFLLCIGEKGREIYRTLPDLPPETVTLEDGTEEWRRTTAQLKDAFRAYCNPRKNLTLERHKFLKRDQGEAESIDQYVTALRTLASTCEFGDLKDSLIKDKIVCGVKSQALRGRLLREAVLDLQRAIDISRASELSKEQMKTLSADPKKIDHLGKNKRQQKQRGKQPQQQSKPSNDRTPQSQKKPCGNCGRNHEPRSCPAYGKACRSCGKLGHFSKLCRSSRKPVHDLCYESDESAGLDEITIDSLTSNSEHSIALSINNTDVTVKLDTGAEANILTLDDFRRAVPKKQRKRALRTSKAKLTAFGGHNIPTMGTCKLECSRKNIRRVIEFHVVENGRSILGCEDCKAFNLVSFNLDEVASEHKSQEKNGLADLSNDEILEKYATCFDGLGRISEPYHIKLDENASPVIHPPRKIPAALRDKVQHELQQMESQGVIKRVNEPTKWVNSMVVNEKRDGRLRICMDPRDLNKSIQREHYQLPTQQEITSRLAGARYFSKLDAKSGFWQMPLDDESSYLTTFNTPFGRYRFTVIPFGVVFAQEVFHRTVSELFSDINGCETEIDDILVWGETLEQHDANLERVLNRVKESNMTLNKAKCTLRAREVTYLGERLTADGVKADEEKLKAIRDYTRPESRQDVLRLLGMVNFIAKFAPGVSDVTAPLRDLTKKNVEFHWLEHHEKAFNNLKSKLTDRPAVLKYYDVKKPVTLQVDASQAGLGAVLYQEDGPVAYASKALNQTQQNYAQIEKELLAVLFACKRFHQYIYGKKALVESDHKPLEAIFQKPLSQAPPRLQKMLMQLQEYDLDLRYKKGTEMI